jgi:4-amino-4-deoxy-L-arabinose transferase-like glycosyltransferase
MRLQVLGLVAVAALLPLLGHALLGWRGFAAGIIGGAILVHSYAGVALTILTEVLICISIFLVLAAWAQFQRRNGWAGGVVLGASLALGLLVKGATIFLPGLFLGYALLRAFGSHTYRISGVLAAILVCVLPVALWSAYATARAGRLVLLCTQGPDILLDGNNEYSLVHGHWNPPMERQSGQFLLAGDAGAAASFAAFARRSILRGAPRVLAHSAAPEARQRELGAPAAVVHGAAAAHHVMRTRGSLDPAVRSAVRSIGRAPGGYDPTSSGLHGQFRAVADASGRRALQQLVPEGTGHGMARPWGDGVRVCLPELPLYHIDTVWQ